MKEQILNKEKERKEERKKGRTKRNTSKKHAFPDLE